MDSFVGHKLPSIILFQWSAKILKWFCSWSTINKEGINSLAIKHIANIRDILWNVIEAKNCIIFAHFCIQFAGLPIVIIFLRWTVETVNSFSTWFRELSKRLENVAIFYPKCKSITKHFPHQIFCGRYIWWQIYSLGEKVYGKTSLYAYS